MHEHGGNIYQNPGKIDFSANINFRGMPDAVRRAATTAIDASVFYPDPHCARLKEAIAVREGVPAEWIFCGNGAADVIFSLVLAEKPKCALLLEPSFYEYRQALASVDCAITSHLLKKEENFILTEAILPKITKESDLLFVCNPNNPTGQIVEQRLLETIAEKCMQTGTRLVADECFNDFLEDGAAHTLLGKLQENPKIFVVKAFTKMYGMAGLRLGYGICNDTDLIRRMEEVTQPWRVSVPAQAAGIAAAEDTQYPKITRKEIAVEKQQLLDGLLRAGFRVYGSAANFIFFEAEPGLDETLKKEGFLIRSCANFMGLSEGFYRIAIRGKADNEAFLAALETSLPMRFG